MVFALWVAKDRDLGFRRVGKGHGIKGLISFCPHFSCRSSWLWKVDPPTSPVREAAQEEEAGTSQNRFNRSFHPAPREVLDHLGWGLLKSHPYWPGWQPPACYPPPPSFRPGQDPLVKLPWDSLLGTQSSWVKGVLGGAGRGSHLPLRPQPPAQSMGVSAPE